MLAGVFFALNPTKKLIRFNTMDEQIFIVSSEGERVKIAISDDIEEWGLARELTRKIYERKVSRLGCLRQAQAPSLVAG